MNNRCSLPFTELTNISMDTGMVTPCCKIPVTPLDPVHGIFNKIVTEVRQSIIDNVRSPHCKACWDIIDAGGISRRTQLSTHDTYDWENASVTQPVEHIQVKFSKTCQLQCVYCGPWASTTWQKNLEAYNGFRGKDTDELCSDLDLGSIIDVSKLKTIQVSGGEPLLDKQCIDFLLNLPFDPSRKISLITNLSYGKAVLADLLKITKKHPTITIRASLDAIGDNDSRKYLNWGLWKSNFGALVADLVDRKKDYPVAVVNVKATINLLTYEKTQELIDFIIDYKKSVSTGVTFAFGTPFQHEMSSMWSGNINKAAKITISKNDLLLLNNRESTDIAAFNNMIDNAVPNQELSAKTKKYIAIYKSE